MSVFLYVASLVLATLGSGLLYWGITADVAVGEVANFQALFQQLGVITMGTGAIIASACLLAAGAITEAVTRRRD